MCNVNVGFSIAAGFVLFVVLFSPGLDVFLVLSFPGLDVFFIFGCFFAFDFLPLTFSFCFGIQIIIFFMAKIIKTIHLHIHIITISMVIRGLQ